MTPKHATEVRMLQNKMRRIKIKAHVDGCPSCQAKRQAAKEAHAQKVALQMGKAFTPTEDSQGLSMVLSAKKIDKDDAKTVVFGSGGGRYH